MNLNLKLIVKLKENIIYQKKLVCDKLEKNLQDKIEQYKQNIRRLKVLENYIMYIYKLMIIMKNI